MRWTSALAIYFIVWWVVFFAVLPFGVRTPDEAGATRVPGQADSAPARPQLVRKALWTSVIAALLFGLFYLVYVNEWIRRDQLPGYDLTRAAERG